MKRRLKILLYVLVAIIGLVMLGKSWLMNTESGAGWVLKRVSSSLEEQLSIQDLSGNLNDGLVLNNVRFEQADLRIEIARVEITAGFELLPIQLNISSLQLQDMTVWKATAKVAAKVQAGPASDMNVIGVSVEDLLTELQLPIAIDLQDVQVNGFNLRDSGDEILLHFDSVSLSGLWKDEIQLRQLAIVSPVVAASLQGQISLTAPFAHQWSGSVKLVGIESVSLLTGEFELQGVPDDYRLELRATGEIDQLPAIQLALQGQGGLLSIALNNVDVDSDFLQASGEGVIDWSAQASIDLELEIARMEPTLWLADWPREHFVHGRISLLSNQAGLQIKQLNVKVAGTEASVQGEAVLDPLAGVIEGRLAWQNLGWPLGPQTQVVSSDSGELQLSGAPADWQFAGTLEVETEQYPGGSFALSGKGGMQSASIIIDAGEALGGTLAGQASLDWASALRWDAQLDVVQLDLAALPGDWPLRLTATLNMLQDTGEELFELQFAGLHGELQGEFKGQSVTGQSVTGHGGLVMNAAGIRFNDIQLRSGGSTLSLHGNPADATGVEFELGVHQQDWLAAVLGGQVSGRGRVALLAPQPVVDIELEASGLAWGETRIGSLSINSGPDHDKTGGKTGDKSGLDLRLEARELEFGGLSVQSVRAVLGGGREQQSLEISLNQAGYVLAAKFSGAISDWNALASSDWSGHLQQLSLASAGQTLVTLQDTADLLVSSTQLSLGPACLNIADSGELCVESRWHANGNMDFTARASALSLNASKLIYAHDIEFTQQLDGELQWQHKPGQYPSGRAAINISAGEIDNPQGEFDPVSTAAGFFGFELSHGNLTAGELDIPFPGYGLIDLDYAISGMALDGTGKVDGKVKIELTDISVLAELLPALDKVSGQVDIDLRVTGVTIDPVLRGSVALTNAAVDIAYVGTQLRQVSLLGVVDSTDKASLQGEFVAGDGQGRISMQADYSDWMNPAFEMNFSGTSLRLLNTAELRVDADPAISLAWRRGEWLIDGEVIVQQARIAPVTFVVDKVTESEDIRIVAGSLPHGGQQEPVQPIRLTGKLDVRLGDDVKIDTDLASLKLSGAVMLTWGGQVIPIADGSIHGDGTLSVFGPKLHVTDGQVRFPGVAVNNPMLEIRAERNIFGNTQIRTAGVGITGPAKRPVIEAYTNPITTRDRAWAMLITGSDVDYGQGVGAFEVGAYIAPKLYLSYGISLFDNDNVVSARYDLKKGFGIKASSGQRESGFDLSYTIDR